MRDKRETVATLIGALFFVLILVATVGGGIYGIIQVLSGDDDVSEVESDNTSQNENWEAEAEENKRDIELSRELCNINMKDFMSLCLQYRNSVGRFPRSVADLSNLYYLPSSPLVFLMNSYRSIIWIINLVFFISIIIAGGII